MIPLLQLECTAYVHGSLFCHWQAWCSEHFEQNQTAGIKEVVWYLYHYFNRYNGTRSLIQNRYTACLQGLLTIICNVHVNVCCQMIVNTQNSIYSIFLPLTCIKWMCQLSSIQAVQWCFFLQENRILVLTCLALLVPIIYNSAYKYQISAAGEYIDNFIEIFCRFNIALMTKCSRQQHCHNSRWMGNFRDSSWPIKNSTTLKRSLNTIRTQHVQIVYEYHEIYIRSKYSTRVHNERLE